jgi:hypothetical protein
LIAECGLGLRVFECVDLGVWILVLDFGFGFEIVPCPYLLPLNFRS